MKPTNKPMRARSFGISPVIQVTKGLKILHNNSLKDPYRGVPQEYSISDVLPVGRNFFYKLYAGSQQIEEGICELRKEGTVYYVDREFAFKCLYEGRLIKPRNNKPADIISDTVYTLQSYCPDNYKHTLASPNSVLCSIQPFEPTPVEIEQSAVLGRLGDDPVDSIKFEDLGTAIFPQIKKILRESKSPLILSATEVDLSTKDSRISCGQLFIKPRPTPPKKRTEGFIYYNENSKCLEYFDGSRWRRVMWEYAE